MELTKSDWALIAESLKYTKLKFESYDEYPSLEFKRKRIDEVEKVIAKVNTIKASI